MFLLITAPAIAGSLGPEALSECQKAVKRLELASADMDGAARALEKPIEQREQALENLAQTGDIYFNAIESPHKDISRQRDIKDQQENFQKARAAEQQAAKIEFAAQEKFSQASEIFSQRADEVEELCKPSS